LFSIIASVVPVFVVLKILEKFRESEVLGRPLSFPNAVVTGLLYRLDNPSFWNVVAVTLAGLLVTRGMACLGLEAQREIERRPWAKYVMAWVAPAFVLGAMYLSVVWFNKETFFFRFSTGLMHNDQLTLLIQDIEGVCNILVIALAPSILFIALRGVDYLKDRLPFATAENERNALKECAGLIRSAGLGPVISASIALAFWKIVSIFSKYTPKAAPDWFGASSVLVVVVFLFFLYVPFYFLFTWPKKTLGKILTFKARRIEPPEQTPFWFPLAFLGTIALGWISEAEFKDEAKKPEE